MSAIRTELGPWDMLKFYVLLPAAFFVVVCLVTILIWSIKNRLYLICIGIRRRSSNLSMNSSRINELRQNHSSTRERHGSEDGLIDVESY